MATSQTVVDVLDEAIKVLAIPDSDCLDTLEQRITMLAQSSFIFDEAGLRSILAKKRVLELVLHSSASNLNALNRLYGRDMRDQWAH